jgi:hypothetical protein
MSAMYQIRFARNGGASYEYFEAEPDKAPAEACEKANDYIERRRARVFMSIAPFKPVRTASVVEYDRNTKAAKKHGHRFKIRLQYIQMEYIGGRKHRDYWYAPIED